MSPRRAPFDGSKMNRRRAPATPRPAARRWHIPPPLVHGAEPLEGGAVLAEVGGPLGVIVWQGLRDVLLWAETPPEERRGLFAPEAGDARSRSIASAAPDDALREPLSILRDLAAAPFEAIPAVVADACAAIRKWAEKRGALATALAYAQNSALAEPTAPARALIVARLAVELGDHARAEIWYRRAIGIARRARNWRVYARAFSGLATLYQDRGNLPAAQRFHLRALRGARRGGLRGERAVALHDLFGVAVETGRAGDADRYAREAFAAYSPGNRRLAALAHDVAYFWMEEGHFARAVEVFQAVAPLIDEPAQRLWVESDLMRAAAGAGDDTLARRVAERVREQSALPELSSAAARAQLELARGELLLEDWEAAKAAAEEALRLARMHREGRTLLMAEALLEAIRADRTAGRAAPRDPKKAPAAVDTLAADLVRSLQGLNVTATAAERRNADSTELDVNRMPMSEARTH